MITGMILSWFIVGIYYEYLVIGAYDRVTRRIYGKSFLDFRIEVIARMNPTVPISEHKTYAIIGSNIALYVAGALCGPFTGMHRNNLKRVTSRLEAIANEANIRKI